MPFLFGGIIGRENYYLGRWCYEDEKTDNHFIIYTFAGFFYSVQPDKGIFATG